MKENPPDEKLDALLRHALRCASRSEPPPGFAREVASLVADQPETAGFEIWATRGLVGLAVFASGVGTLMLVDSISQHVLGVFNRAPWSLLLTCTGVLGAIKLAEIAQIHRPGRTERRSASE